MPASLSLHHNDRYAAHQSSKRPFLFGLAAILVAALTGQSGAHTNLVSAVPAPDSVVAAAPATLALNFSEDLEPAFSSVEVIGPNGTPVPGTAVAVDSADATRLIVSLPSGLLEGRYEVDWVAVATDGHKLTGNYVFSVK
jgi:methionine-rich copper-binding protein CopC